MRRLARFLSATAVWLPFGVGCSGDTGTELEEMVLDESHSEAPTSNDTAPAIDGIDSTPPGELLAEVNPSDTSHIEFRELEPGNVLFTGTFHIEEDDPPSFQRSDLEEGNLGELYRQAVSVERFDPQVFSELDRARERMLAARVHAREYPPDRVTYEDVVPISRELEPDEKDALNLVPKSHQCAERESWFLNWVDSMSIGGRRARQRICATGIFEPTGLWATAWAGYVANYGHQDGIDMHFAISKLICSYFLGIPTVCNYRAQATVTVEDMHYGWAILFSDGQWKTVIIPFGRTYSTVSEYSSI